MNAAGRVAPPEHTKWKKGCASPNPNGRPSVRSAMRRVSDAAKAVLAQVDEKTGKTGAEQLAELMFRRAKQGSIKHAALLLAYAEGRPPQNVNVSGGLLHAHAWRPLGALTDEEFQQLVAIRKRLSAPEEDAGGAATTFVEAQPQRAELSEPPQPREQSVRSSSGVSS